jgi:hypothetical protein
MKSIKWQMDKLFQIARNSKNDHEAKIRIKAALKEMKRNIPEDMKE